MKLLMHPLLMFLGIDLIHFGVHSNVIMILKLILVPTTGAGRNDLVILIVNKCF
jgi:hypothetical protein